MRTTESKINYVVWLSPEVMHEASRKWLSELEFIKGEQLFFRDLIKSYALYLIDSKHIDESRKVIENLNKIKKKTTLLAESVQNHENKLIIWEDSINHSKEEERYKTEHRKLIIEVSKFFQNYRIFKTKFFDLIKEIIKEQRQKRLLK
jgi:tRNA/tmRNA/rRNA uracil-C5-methylase (TrmA/RlmC/RlmD family)